MKKLIFVLLASLCLLSSCCEDCYNKEVYPEITVDEEIGKKVSTKVLKVEKFKYDGHSYLLFVIGVDGRWHSNIIHDPNCKKCK